MSFSASGVTGQFALARFLQDVPGVDQTDPASQTSPSGGDSQSAGGGAPNVNAAGASQVSPDVWGLLFEFSMTASRDGGGPSAGMGDGSSSGAAAPVPAAGAASAPTQDSSDANSADPLSSIMQDLSSLISAVKSGSISDAQNALDALQQASQSAPPPGRVSHHHHHHHGGGAPSAASTSGDVGAASGSQPAVSSAVSATATSSEAQAVSIPS